MRMSHYGNKDVHTGEKIIFGEYWWNFARWKRIRWHNHVCKFLRLST